MQAAMQTSLEYLQSTGARCLATAGPPPSAVNVDTNVPYTTVRFFIPYANRDLASQWVIQATLDASWWYNLYESVGAGCDSTEQNGQTTETTVQVRDTLHYHGARRQR